MSDLPTHQEIIGRIIVGQDLPLRPFLVNPGCQEAARLNGGSLRGVVGWMRVTVGGKHGHAGRNQSDPQFLKYRSRSRTDMIPTTRPSSVIARCRMPFSAMRSLA